MREKESVYVNSGDLISGVVERWKKENGVDYKRIHWVARQWGQKDSP